MKKIHELSFYYSVLMFYTVSSICHQDGRFYREIQAITEVFLAALPGLVAGLPRGNAIKTEKKSKIIATGCRTGVFYSYETV